MAHRDKARAAGVSATSFLDLKTEIAQKQVEKRGKVAKTSQNNAKKGSVWSRPNRGVAARNARDIAIEEAAANRQTTESVRAALERKAAIYDKLKKGQTGGLSDAQYDALLVDFDSKDDGGYSSHSDDVDESLTVPRPPGDDDDPIVEYEDEFGRTRTARRSEVPRHLRPDAKADSTVDDVDPFVIENPVNHFPVYQPSEERIAAIKEAASEEANPLASHYDASREVRAKGAAFYSFSKNEEERAREMEELRSARVETEKTRKETGAVDILPGEADGVVDGVGADERAAGSASSSRAMEKRKREIEERRALIEAKRKKMKEAKTEVVQIEEKSTTITERLEGKMREEGSIDPFSMVERTQRDNVKPAKGKSRWDEKKTSKDVAADAFLAQLETELVKKG